MIENYRLGTMERLGLGYDDLAAINPRLIYCEISGFGRTGPYAERGGFDLIAQGMAGLMSITGEGPGRPPVKVAAPISDINAGILAAMGVSAAYANALKTGRGQKVDTSLFEAAIVQTYWQSAIAFSTGENPEPLAPRTRSMRLIRRSRPATAGSMLGPRTSATGSVCWMSSRHLNLMPTRGFRRTWRGCKTCRRLSKS